MLPSSLKQALHFVVGFGFKLIQGSYAPLFIEATVIVNVS